MGPCRPSQTPPGEPREVMRPQIEKSGGLGSLQRKFWRDFIVEESRNISSSSRPFPLVVDRWRASLPGGTFDRLLHLKLARMRVRPPRDSPAASRSRDLRLPQAS